MLADSLILEESKSLATCAREIVVSMEKATGVYQLRIPFVLK